MVSHFQNDARAASVGRFNLQGEQRLPRKPTVRHSLPMAMLSTAEASAQHSQMTLCAQSRRAQVHLTPSLGARALYTYKAREVVSSNASGRPCLCDSDSLWPGARACIHHRFSFLLPQQGDISQSGTEHWRVRSYLGHTQGGRGGREESHQGDSG